MHRVDELEAAPVVDPGTVAGVVVVHTVHGFGFEALGKDNAFLVEAAERGSVEGVLDRELEDRGGRGEDDPGLLAGDVGPGGEVLDEGVDLFALLRRQVVPREPAGRVDLLGHLRRKAGAVDVEAVELCRRQAEGLKRLVVALDQMRPVDREQPAIDQRVFLKAFHGIGAWQ